MQEKNDKNFDNNHNGTRISNINCKNLSENINNENFYKFMSEYKISFMKMLYQDMKKKINYIFVSDNSQIFILKISNICGINLSMNLDFNDCSQLAHCIFLNRIYLVNSLTSVYMIEMETKKSHEIILEDEKLLELCKNNSYVFVNTKILFTGGIKKSGGLNSDIISFDISTYKFEKEKIRENNFIARHSHGSVELMEIIYVIGGFISEEERDDKICDKIQLIKFDHMFNNWVELNVDGQKPIFMIRPQISFYDDKYLICFSSYKYPKIWYLNLKTNIGCSIDLSEVLLYKDIEPLIDLSQIIFNYNFDSNLMRSNILYISKKDDTKLVNCSFDINI